MRLSESRVTRQQSFGLFAFMLAYYAVAFSIGGWGASAHSPPLVWVGLSIFVLGMIVQLVLTVRWRRPTTTL